MADEIIRQILALLQQDNYERNNRRNFLKTANDYRGKIGNFGNTLSRSDNPFISNIGSKIYNFSGQNAINTLKSNASNAIKTGIQNIGSKIMPQATNTVATTAGTLAETAGSLAGAAIPVATAALMAYQTLKSHGDKKRNSAMQEANQLMAENVSKANDKKIQAMQGVQNNTVQNTNFSDALNADNSTNNNIISGILDKWKNARNFNNNGYFTGGAADVFPNTEIPGLSNTNNNTTPYKKVDITTAQKNWNNFVGTLKKIDNALANSEKTENFLTKKLDGNDWLTRPIGATDTTQYVPPVTTNNNITIDSPVGQKILADYENKKSQNNQNLPAKPKVQSFVSNSMPQSSMNSGLPEFVVVEPDGTIHKNDLTAQSLNPQENGKMRENPFKPFKNIQEEQPTEEQIQETPYTGRFSGLINGGGDFISGFKDNYNNSFNPKNLIPQNKNALTKLGEAFGTTARLAQSPILQAALAAYLTKQFGGTSGQAALNAYKYGTQKQMSNIYDKVLKDYGINVPNGIFNNIQSNDVNSILKLLENQYDREYKYAKLQNDINSQNIRNNYYNQHLKNDEERLKLSKQQAAQNIKPWQKPNWGNDIADFYTRYTDPKYTQEEKREIWARFFREYKVDPLKYITLPKNDDINIDEQIEQARII